MTKTRGQAHLHSKRNAASNMLCTRGHSEISNDKSSNVWLPTTLRSYNRSTNGCRWASGAMQNDLRAAGAKQLWDGGLVAEHKYKRIACICCVGVATGATQPPHAPRNTPRASATTTTLRPARQDPRPRVSNYLPAAGGHRPPSTASSPAAATYGARAGRAPLADRELGLSPTQPPCPSP